MKTTLHWLRALAIAMLMLPLAMASGRAADLQPIRLGAVPKAITPIMIDFVVGEYLGYYKQEGLTVQVLPLGSNAAAAAALASGRAEFYLAAPAFQIPLLVKGDTAGVDFYESTYPFKFALGVTPGSPVKTITDLKGKKVGVAAIGNSEYPVARAVLQLAGLDPDKDVSWISTGDGVAMAVALQRGDVDAVFTIDTNWGLIESTGLKPTYLDMPKDLPQVGGVYVATTPDILKNHRDWAVGFARAVAKSHIFIRENPEAAAYIYGQMFPEAMPKGKDLQEQVQAAMVPIVKRMKLFVPSDPSISPPGSITKQEWADEIKFGGLTGQVPDISALYTNDLVADINNFDPAVIKAQADAFKLPYKN